MLYLRDFPTDSSDKLSSAPNSLGGQILYVFNVVRPTPGLAVGLLRIASGGRSMTVKRLLRTGAVAALATTAIAAFHLISQGALQRAMTAIASAVWGS